MSDELRFRQIEDRHVALAEDVKRLRAAFVKDVEYGIDLFTRIQKIEAGQEDAEPEALVSDIHERVLERTAAVECNLARAFKRIVALEQPKDAGCENSEAWEKMSAQVGERFIWSTSSEMDLDRGVTLDSMDPGSGFVSIIDDDARLHCVRMDLIRPLKDVEDRMERAGQGLSDPLIIEPNAKAGLDIKPTPEDARLVGSKVRHCAHEWEVCASFMGFCLIGRDLGGQKPYIVCANFEDLHDAVD